MAAIALIKFTQGLVVGDPGVALAGVADVPVLIENDSITDIQSWKIDLLYAPPGGLVSAGTLATGNSSTPSASFTPSITPGPYRILLTVYTGPDLSGSRDRDIRVFAVPHAKGFIFPPYQQLPPKLPILGSGSPGEKPDEMNFGNQPYGWDGAGDDGLLLDFMRTVASGVSARDTVYWDGSNADGSLDGFLFHLEEDFQAEFGKIHLWITAAPDDFTATMPVAIEDDHNRCVAFYGASTQCHLTLTAPGSFIMLNPELGDETVKIAGGGLHVFRWDGANLKWKLTQGSLALVREELLRLLQATRFNAQITLTDPQTNDYDGGTDLAVASYLYMNPTDQTFQKLTGISSELRDLPWFVPRKTIYNGTSNPCVLIANSGDSTDSFEAAHDITLFPGEAAEILLASDDSGRWELQKLGETRGPEIRKGLIAGGTVEVGEQDGELFACDGTANTTLNVHDGTFPGQCFYVHVLSGDASGATLHPSGGQPIQDPASPGAFGLSDIHIRSSFGMVKFVWFGAWFIEQAASGFANTTMVRNESGSALLRGAPVYATGAGAFQDTPLADLASAASGSPANYALGFMVEETTSNNAYGTIQTAGLVYIPSGIRAEDWTAGDRIYLSPVTPGLLTKSAPSTPGQVVALVGIAHNTASGADPSYMLVFHGTPSTVPSSSGDNFANGASFYPRLILSQAPTADLVLDADRLYMLYLGYFGTARSVSEVLFYMVLQGAGAQDAQIGLFTTPNGPEDTDQTFTKVSAQGVVTDLTSGGNIGPIREAVSWTFSGHCYLGIRTNMAVTQPKLATVRDLVQIGEHSTISASGDLTAFVSGLGDRFGSSRCPYFVAVG